MKKLVIYRVYHKESGKSYIGKCTKGDVRVKTHFKFYSNSKLEYRAKLLYRAMKKHGAEKFDYEILYEAVTIEELNGKEKEYIDLFNSRDPSKGYNIRHGGDGGDTWEGLTSEARATRIKKQSEAQTGTYSDERRQNSSILLKTIRADKNRSAKNAEVCSERMSRLNKDPNWPRGKKVYCVETGEIFNNMKALAISLNIKAGHVQYCMSLKDGHIGELQYKLMDKK